MVAMLGVYREPPSYLVELRIRGVRDDETARGPEQVQSFVCMYFVGSRQGVSATGSGVSVTPRSLMADRESSLM